MCLAAEDSAVIDQSLVARKMDAAVAALDHRLGGRSGPAMTCRTFGLAAARRDPGHDDDDSNDDQVLHVLRYGCCRKLLNGPPQHELHDEARSYVGQEQQHGA